MIEKIKNKEKIVVLTAYDYSNAKLCEEAGVDIILVGDSLAMVFQGNEDTKSVKMEEMLYHTKAVARGAKKTLIIGDMPINSYNTPELTLKNAKLFLEAGAHGVKIEGSKPEIISTLLKNNIPVMGHIGLLPQTAKQYKVQGKDKESAEKLVKDARELDNLGVFTLILECIPTQLAKEITESTKCKTIGIGAGPHCNGQVLVINDMLGLYDKFTPKFVRKYANLHDIIKEAINNYKKDVEERKFPNENESYS